MTLDPKTLERLSAYLDGALSAPEAAALETLLARDAEARRALEGLRSLRSDLKNLPPAAPPESFYSRVWRDIDAPPARRSFLSYVPLKTAGALAAAALVVTATHDFWRTPAARQADIVELARKAPSPLQMLQTPIEAQQMPAERNSLLSKDTAPELVDEVSLDSRLKQEESSLRSEPARARRNEDDLKEAPASKALGAAGGERDFGDGARMDALQPQAAAAKIEVEEYKKKADQPAKARAPSVGGKVSQERGAPESLAPAAAPAAAGEWAGPDSGIRHFEKVVIRDAAAWTALWRRHAPGRPAPPLDFSRSMVVAVFAGEKPTGGYAVEILGVAPRAGRLVVSYRLTAPPPDAFVSQAFTSPFRMTLVDISDLPAVFEPK